MQRGWCHMAIGLGGCIVITTKASAGDMDPTRQEMHDYYRSQTSRSLSIFGSPPMGHIIPRRGHISLAANADSVDLVVAPPGTIITDRNNVDQKVTMKGWGTSPFVSFSGDRFGIGFAGEGGYRQVEYSSRYRITGGGIYSSAQIGTVQYSGVGLYGYFMPTFKFLPKYVITNFVLGGKQLYVVHYTQWKSTQSKSDKNKYRYGVQKYDVGMDVGLELVKRFTILPWVNYTMVRPDTARDAGDSGNKVKDDILDADRSLLWHTLPKLTYGIDFAVNIFHTDLHLGGLLGLVGNLFKGSDRISDQSISLGITYEIK